MARLPIPGQDAGTWGEVLNDFLRQSLNEDGSLKPPAVFEAGAASDSSVVHTSGAETVAGTKTFQASPYVPSPIQSGHAASKVYVDSAIAAGGPDATTSSKGIIQLAGDLGGTAASPTVPGLAGKANTSHAHAIADVTNLQTTLDNKANISHTHPATDINDATATGRAVLTAASAAAARSAIGAGTSDLTIGTSATTAAAGNDARLSDERTPLDGSVTNIKVASSAAIDLDKTADSATRLAMTSAERTKLAGLSPLPSATEGQALIADSVGTYVSQTPPWGGGDMFRSGFYTLGAYGGNLTTFGAATVGILAARPFILPVRKVFDRIGIHIVTAGTAGAEMRLGIYNMANGLPSTLILDAGTVATATAGAKEIVINQSLSAGSYFLVAVAQTAACTPVHLGAAITPWTSRSTPFINSNPDSVPYMSSVTGALPANFVVTGIAEGVYPRPAVCLRVG